MRRIGIDFGTCNIKGAEKKKNGDIRYIKLGKKEGKERIPNVSLYEKREENILFHVGDTALKKPAPVQDKIKHIKSFLQEEDWGRELSFGKVVNAYEVVLDIMKTLFDELHMANKSEDISVTITVPVNFSKRQQKVVELAAKNAGFIVENIITEPFAALFYLMQDVMGKDEHNVLVFDFGGGTLDLCLAEITQNNDKTRIETQSTVGISYGGNNINDDIIEHLLKKKVSEQLSQALEGQASILHNEVNKYFLMEAIDSLKAELFDDEHLNMNASGEIMIHLYDGTVVHFGDYSVKEIYDMFDSQGWKKRIFQLLDSLFDNSSSLIPNEVTDVFMVGGTSSIPYFRKVLEEYFEINGHTDVESIFEPNDDMDTEERIYSAVSKGAAIYSELIETGKVEIRDRIPFMVYSKDEKNKECTRISLDVCYEGYSSSLAPITHKIKSDKKIAIYQKIYGEDDKEVFLGNIELNDEIIDCATLFRLTVDKQRNITAEFGHLADMDTTEYEETFCREWSLDLLISI